MMRPAFFSGWNWVRLLRLLLGVFVSFQAIETHDWLSGILAVILLFQAITNVGCCNTSCVAPTNNKQLNESDEPIFEEIK